MRHFLRLPAAALLAMARLGTSPPRRRARLRPGRVQLAGEIDIDAGDFDIGRKLEVSNTQP
jgi:hypothetical protein